jgi:predicted Zn-dependent peptidase
MTFPEVRLQPPEHRRLELPNGTVLYLLEDHEVPLVNVRVLLRTGSVFDPPGKSGLAGLTGRVLRAGGTDRYRAPRLNEKIESMGARLETSIGREAGHASLSVLSSDVEEGLGLLAEVLRNPAFPEADRGDPPGQRRPRHHRLPRTAGRRLRRGPEGTVPLSRDDLRYHP